MGEVGVGGLAGGGGAKQLRCVVCVWYEGKEETQQFAGFFPSQGPKGRSQLLYQPEAEKPSRTLKRTVRSEGFPWEAFERMFH